MRIVYDDMSLLTGPTTALAFLLDPQTTRMAGSVIIDGVLRDHPHVQSVSYLARMTESGPEFNHQEAADLIASAAQCGPVLIVGYPSLIAAAIDCIRGRGVKNLALPTDSLILTGGGWKSTLPGIQLNQHEFDHLAAEFFAVPKSAIRDMFGLSECPAVFLQCASGNYHVPAFAWAQAVDPETHSEVSAGQIGLLQITTPLTTSYPLLRILTTDKVRVSSCCDCGLQSPCLLPQGRVSAARFETCAMRVGQALG
jgi:phenylacetate-coenzyme A ligase PaaK-like adenylate-forming protein